VKPTQAIVHVREKLEDGWGLMQQVNWDDPKYHAGDYREYASTFYNFIAPAGAQEIRATLLAEALKVPVSIQIFKETPGDTDINGKYVPPEKRRK
jgi:hypothetical protein